MENISTNMPRMLLAIVLFSLACLGDLAILRQAEGGVPVPELCREHGMSTASFYKWRSKYGGMDASMISQMKALEDENRRLKKMYAEMSMQAELLKEVLGKNGPPRPCKRLDIANDESSCINVSGLSRVGCCCSQAMMRSAQAVPNKWFGHEARFFAQDLRHVDPLFRHHYSRALQSSQERQANAGSLRS